jgi:hypothetical protein
MDIHVEVPENESAGSKSSNVIFSAGLAEWIKK